MQELQIEPPQIINSSNSFTTTCFRGKVYYAYVVKEGIWIANESLRPVQLLQPIPPENFHPKNVPYPPKPPSQTDDEIPEHSEEVSLCFHGITGTLVVGYKSLVIFYSFFLIESAPEGDDVAAADHFIQQIGGEWREIKRFDINSYNLLHKPIPHNTSSHNHQNHHHHVTTNNPLTVKSLAWSERTNQLLICGQTISLFYIPFCYLSPQSPYLINPLLVMSPSINLNLQNRSDNIPRNAASASAFDINFPINLNYNFNAEIELIWSTHSTIEIYFCSFSPDGRYFITAGLYDRMPKIWQKTYEEYNRSLQQLFSKPSSPSLFDSIDNSKNSSKQYGDDDDDDDDDDYDQKGSTFHSAAKKKKKQERINRNYKKKLENTNIYDIISDDKKNEDGEEDEEDIIEYNDKKFRLIYRFSYLPHPRAIKSVKWRYSKYSNLKFYRNLLLTTCRDNVTRCWLENSNLSFSTAAVIESSENSIFSWVNYHPFLTQYLVSESSTAGVSPADDFSEPFYANEYFLSSITSPVYKKNKKNSLVTMEIENYLRDMEENRERQLDRFISNHQVADRENDFIIEIKQNHLISFWQLSGVVNNIEAGSSSGRSKGGFASTMPELTLWLKTKVSRLYLFKHPLHISAICKELIEEKLSPKRVTVVMINAKGSICEWDLTIKETEDQRISSSICSQNLGHSGDIDKLQLHPTLPLLISTSSSTNESILWTYSANQVMSYTPITGGVGILPSPLVQPFPPSSSSSLFYRHYHKRQLLSGIPHVIDDKSEEYGDDEKCKYVGGGFVDESQQKLLNSPFPHLPHHQSLTKYYQLTKSDDDTPNLKDNNNDNGTKQEILEDDGDDEESELPNNGNTKDITSDLLISHDATRKEFLIYKIFKQRQSQNSTFALIALFPTSSAHDLHSHNNISNSNPSININFSSQHSSRFYTPSREDGLKSSSNINRNELNGSSIDDIKDADIRDQKVALKEFYIIPIPSVSSTSSSIHKNKEKDEEEKKNTNIISDEMNGEGDDSDDSDSFKRFHIFGIHLNGRHIYVWQLDLRCLQQNEYSVDLKYHQQFDMTFGRSISSSAFLPLFSSFTPFTPQFFRHHTSTPDSTSNTEKKNQQEDADDDWGYSFEYKTANNKTKTLHFYDLHFHVITGSIDGSIRLWRISPSSSDHIDVSTNRKLANVKWEEVDGGIFGHSGVIVDIKIISPFRFITIGYNTPLPKSASTSLLTHSAQSRYHPPSHPRFYHSILFDELYQSEDEIDLRIWELESSDQISLDHVIALPNAISPSSSLSKSSNPYLVTRKKHHTSAAPSAATASPRTTLINTSLLTVTVDHATIKKEESEKQIDNDTEDEDDLKIDRYEYEVITKLVWKRIQQLKTQYKKATVATMEFDSLRSSLLIAIADRSQQISIYTQSRYFTGDSTSSKLTWIRSPRSLVLPNPIHSLNWLPAGHLVIGCSSMVSMYSNWVSLFPSPSPLLLLSSTLSDKEIPSDIRDDEFSLNRNVKKSDLEITDISDEWMDCSLSYTTNILSQAYSLSHSLSPYHPKVLMQYLIAGRYEKVEYILAHFQSKLAAIVATKQNDDVLSDSTYLDFDDDASKLRKITIPLSSIPLPSFASLFSDLVTSTKTSNQTPPSTSSDFSSGNMMGSMMGGMSTSSSFMQTTSSAASALFEPPPSSSSMFFDTSFSFQPFGSEPQTPQSGESTNTNDTTTTSTSNDGDNNDQKDGEKKEEGKEENDDKKKNEEVKEEEKKEEKKEEKVEEEDDDLKFTADRAESLKELLTKRVTIAGLTEMDLRDLLQLMTSFLDLTELTNTADSCGVNFMISYKILSSLSSSSAASTLTSSQGGGQSLSSNSSYTLSMMSQSRPSLNSRSTYSLRSASTASLLSPSSLNLNNFTPTFTPSSTNQELNDYADGSMLSSRDWAWALHTEAVDHLISKCLPEDAPWAKARPLGLGFWLTQSLTTLKRVIEQIGKAQYIINKNPEDCALFYILLNKRDHLIRLYKLKDNSRLAEFLNNDFALKNWQTAALKNAYALLGKKNYEYALAFFVLANDLKGAISVCLKNLNDINLPLIICTMIEGENSPTFKWVIEELIIPKAQLKNDVYLLSICYHLLRKYDKALLALLPSTQQGGNSDSVSLSSSSNESSSAASTSSSLESIALMKKNKRFNEFDPTVVNYYRHIVKLPIYQRVKLSAENELILFKFAALSYYSLGIPSLSLDLVSTIKDLEEQIDREKLENNDELSQDDIFAQFTTASPSFGSASTFGNTNSASSFFAPSSTSIFGAPDTSSSNNDSSNEFSFSSSMSFGDFGGGGGFGGGDSFGGGGFGGGGFGGGGFGGGGFGGGGLGSMIIAPPEEEKKEENGSDNKTSKDQKEDDNKDEMTNQMLLRKVANQLFFDKLLFDVVSSWLISGMRYSPIEVAKLRNDYESSPCFKPPSTSSSSPSSFLDHDLKSDFLDDLKYTLQLEEIIDGLVAKVGLHAISLPHLLFHLYHFTHKLNKFSLPLLLFPLTYYYSPRHPHRLLADQTNNSSNDQTATSASTTNDTTGTNDTSNPTSQSSTNDNDDNHKDGDDSLPKITSTHLKLKRKIEKKIESEIEERVDKLLPTISSFLRPQHHFILTPSQLLFLLQQTLDLSKYFHWITMLQLPIDQRNKEKLNDEKTTAESTIYGDQLQEYINTYIEMKTISTSLPSRFDTLCLFRFPLNQLCFQIRSEKMKLLADSIVLLLLVCAWQLQQFNVIQHLLLFYDQRPSTPSSIITPPTPSPTSATASVVGVKASSSGMIATNDRRSGLTRPSSSQVPKAASAAVFSPIKGNNNNNNINSSNNNLESLSSGSHDTKYHYPTSEFLRYCEIKQMVEEMMISLLKKTKNKKYPSRPLFLTQLGFGGKGKEADRYLHGMLRLLLLYQFKSYNTLISVLVDPIQPLLPQLNYSIIESDVITTPFLCNSYEGSSNSINDNLQQLYDILQSSSAKIILNNLIKSSSYFQLPECVTVWNNIVGKAAGRHILAGLTFSLQLSRYLPLITSLAPTKLADKPSSSSSSSVSVNRVLSSSSTKFSAPKVVFEEPKDCILSFCIHPIVKSHFVIANSKGIFEISKHKSFDRSSVISMSNVSRQSSPSQNRKPMPSRATTPVTHLVSHPSAPYYLSGGANGGVYLWIYLLKEALLTFKAPPGPKISKLHFNASGSKFGFCDYSGYLYLHRFNTDPDSLIKPFLIIQANGKKTADFTYCNMGSVVATTGYGGLDHSLNNNNSIFDSLLPPNKSLIASYTAHESAGGQSIIYSPTSQSLITGGKKGDLCIYDIRQRKIREIQKIHDGNIQSMAIDPCDEYFVTASTDGSVKIFEINSMKCVETYPNIHKKVTIVRPENILSSANPLFSKGVLHTVMERNVIYSCGADGRIVENEILR